MPPEIRRCQHFGCGDTRVTLAAVPSLSAALHSLPPHPPSCAHLRKKKPTQNVQNLPANMLPPHILSSPAGLACDRIHGTAAGSSGASPVWQGGHKPAVCLSNAGPKAAITTSAAAQGLERCPQQLRALNLCCLEERGICKQHVPKHSWVHSLRKGRNVPFAWGEKKEDCLWIV